jgi:hypothetical protein
MNITRYIAARISRVIFTWKDPARLIADEKTIALPAQRHAVKSALNSPKYGIDKKFV